MSAAISGAYTPRHLASHYAAASEPVSSTGRARASLIALWFAVALVALFWSLTQPDRVSPTRLTPVDAGASACATAQFTSCP